MTTNKNSSLRKLEKTLKIKLTASLAIQSFRMAKDLSQSALAKKINVARNVICDLEKGRRIVTPELALKIARTLKIDEDILLTLVFQETLNKLGKKRIVELKHVD